MSEVVYHINWNEVKTIKDIKNIIQTLPLKIVINHNNKDEVEVYEKIKDVLLEKEKRPFISFCSQCKGRKHHLEQTLLNNLMCIEKYDNLDYVLLDFDSDDGLLEWIQCGLFKKYFDSGILKYYRVENQPYYLQSGTKNLSHRLSTGINIINVDADNLLCDKYVKIVVKIFTKNPNSYISADVGSIEHAGTFGRIGMPRELFDYIKGYDEIIKWWGCEDDDILARINNLVRSSGATYEHYKIHERILIPPIQHTNDLRVQFSPEYIKNEKEIPYSKDIKSDIMDLINDEYSNLKYNEESIKNINIIKSREYGNTFEVKQLINGELIDIGKI